MSDRFLPLPLYRLVTLALTESRKNRFLGIPGSLFYKPSTNHPFKIERYGRQLSTPLGVAAGPHTQLSQNIIAAWLCGARYIELKTIQTLDDLNVSKPCIDMQDEGYNCEWSQELKIRQSFHEYLNAWILIHILHREMEFDGPVGTLFNMSVGYNLDGILQENVQWFLNKMQDCSEELDQAKNQIHKIYPAINTLDIPSRISDNITLSTMHGCPPEEIEKIGRYLIEVQKLHTTVKLNPTLLGNKALRTILNDQCGFDAQIPDLAFEHDLKYQDALPIIHNLKETSEKQKLHFSVKLTNTLESINIKGIFSETEKMNYLSGRALHPIGIRLARKLQEDHNGALDITFSGGVDCFNVTEVLSCGLKPVTVCSDLLKPGGYGRLYQYLENLQLKFSDLHVGNVDEFILQSAGSVVQSVSQAALINLQNYADQVLINPAYQKNRLEEPNIKTSRMLGYFDCIHAPCVDTCPTHQNIPQYLYQVSQGKPTDALETIFQTNPFPSVTGMVCDHPCQPKCTRINYDQALHIREIKRFAAEQGVKLVIPAPIRNNYKKAAIIGAGPAGLSCAWFLNLAGFDVHVFERNKIAGGMVATAIPSFRLTHEAIEIDIQRILTSGIHFHDHIPVDKHQFESIQNEFDVIFVAVGAMQSVPLNIEGIKTTGVVDPLELLFQVKQGNASLPGRHTVIIGGGNTAMDAARTAFRLMGKNGKVSLLYRRSIPEMPADKNEIEAVKEEGIEIFELINPEKIVTENGQVKSLICSRNILTKMGKGLRPVPVKIPDSEFEFPCDCILPAIGQQPAFDFLDASRCSTEPGSYKTRIPHVYIGGDAMRGASTAINAIADGRKAAEEMIRNLNIHPDLPPTPIDKKMDIGELMRRKSIRKYGISPPETVLKNRLNFNLVMGSLTSDEAIQEASRCLFCDEICNICVTVCPNLANFSYSVKPFCFHLKKAIAENDGLIRFENDQDFSLTQPHQILNIRDFCNECGNCSTFCPTHGRPFSDKPRLCLSPESLNQEEEGYLLSCLPDKDLLIYKEKKRFKTLFLKDGKYYFETEQVKAIMDEKTFDLIDVEFTAPCIREYRFTFAAEMSVILKGAKEIVKW
ncbi:MAG: FAD-dependent oxidoreductase [Bacteroidales bacterium]|nr:FAD-dependent oxidoreductase [Bacteroidales bacterium]